MNYYYFAATLPTLVMDAPPPMTVEEFLRLCRRHLAAGDAEAAEAVLTPAKAAASSHPAVRAWRNREAQLRNAVVRQRAQRAKRDAAPFLKACTGDASGVEAAVAAAFSAASPLDRERALDRMLWEMAEEMAGGDPFSATTVILFGVRLRMAARWAGLSNETGDARARAIVSASPVGEVELADR